MITLNEMKYDEIPFISFISVIIVQIILNPKIPEILLSLQA